MSRIFQTTSAKAMAASSSQNTVRRTRSIRDIGPSLQSKRSKWMFFVGTRRSRSQSAVCVMKTVVQRTSASVRWMGKSSRQCA